MISRTATRPKISPVRQGRSNPASPQDVGNRSRCSGGAQCLLPSGLGQPDRRHSRRAAGRRHSHGHPAPRHRDVVRLAGGGSELSRHLGPGRRRVHGTPRLGAQWADIDAKVAASPTCPKLKSYWHFHGCRYDKISRTCSEPDHIDACPLPSHQLRNGRLNQMAYSLFLFIRDIADGDLVGWIDRQFQGCR